MRAWIVTALAGLLLGGAAGQEGMESLRFLQGCWAGPSGTDGRIEETWTSPDGGVMLATTRYLRGGRVTGWELSRIEPDSSGTPALHPYPNGQASVSFRRARGAPGEAIFENPRHDFPQRITYRAAGADSLTVRIEGGGRAREWRMGRRPCPA